MAKPRSDKKSADGLAALRIDPAPALIREQALGNLRSAIISGYYRPGARLIERELCEAIGVSRTSVREVLRRLEAERLVNILPHKGPVVATITPEQGREIYEVRALLEGEVVKAFVKRASVRQVKDLRRLANAFTRAARNGALANMVGVMSEFYDVLLDGAGNDLIRDLLTSLHARISYLRGASMSRPGRVANSVAEINTIVDAIEDRDEDGAWQACQTHVANAAKAALGRLMEDIGTSE